MWLDGGLLGTSFRHVCCARPIGQRDIDLKRLALPIKRETTRSPGRCLDSCSCRRKVGDSDAIHGNNAIACAHARHGGSAFGKG